MFVNKLTEKKKVLQIIIYTSRIKAANQLIDKDDKLKFPLRIKKILKQKEKCYTITSSINDPNLSLKVCLDNGKIKTYKFHFCLIQGANVLYLPRSDIIGRIIKVHFINEKGAIIVDPKYSTDYEDNQFYNIINFKKIMKEEKNKKEEKQKIARTYCLNMAIGGGGLKNSTSTDSLDTVSQHKFCLGKYDKKFFSMSNLNMNFNVKSILKSRPVKRVSSKRKISCGNVQFSY